MGRAACFVFVAIIVLLNVGSSACAWTQGSIPGDEGASAALARLRTTRPDSTAYILAVRAGGIDLDATLTAYPDARLGVVFLPLGTLAHILDLGIEVDPRAGIARGFFLDEKRRFELDAGRAGILVEDTERPWPWSQIELHEDDIYVAASTLSDWFPLVARPDLRASELRIESREPLPVERRLERERRMAGTTTPAESEPGPVVRTPYQPWDWSAADITLGIAQQPRFRGDGPTWQYGLKASGDCLWLETHAFLTGETDRPWNTVCLTLGRREPDPILLGSLAAREVLAGDVYSPGLDLLTLPSSGRGLLVSNVPLEEPSEFEKQTLRGELAPGWEVELYQNDALVGYRAAGSGGTFEFSDVPILYGANRFRLVFYGPQGQTRTETRIVQLGRSIVPPGTRQYRWVGHVREDGKARGQAELAASLSRRLSATVRVAALEWDTGRDAYAAAGMRASLNRLFVKTDAAFDTSGGVAVQAGLGTRWGPIGIWLQHAKLWHFASEVFQPTYGEIGTRSSARFDASSRLPGIGRLPTSFEYRRDDLRDGGAVHTLSHQVASGVRGIGLFHRLDALFVEIPGRRSAPDRRGTVLLSRSFGRWAARGGAEYGIGDRRGILDLSAVCETRSFPGYLASAELRHRRGETGVDFELRLTRDEGRVGWTFRSALDEGNRARVGIGVTLGLNRDPREGRWYTHAQPGAESGAASALVFLDENGNGAREASEVALPGVTVRAIHSGIPVATDRRGIAMLRGLASGLPGGVGLVTSSLEDPLWLPPARNPSILPRAGRTALVELPILVAGEITGTVYRRTETGRRPISGMRIELAKVDSAQVAHRVRSAYDGFYDIVGVRPGRFVLRVVVERPGEGNVTVASRPIVVPPGGALLEGVDLELQLPGFEEVPLAQPVEPTSEKVR